MFNLVRIDYARCTSSTTAGSRPTGSSFRSDTYLVRPRGRAQGRRSRSPAETRGCERAGPTTSPERLRLLGLRDVAARPSPTPTAPSWSASAPMGLRIHRGYAWAPDRVLRAIVRFLDPRVTPACAARGASGSFWPFRSSSTRRRPRTRPGRSRLGPVTCVLSAPAAAHSIGELNVEHFGGTLGELPIRLSGRMRDPAGRAEPWISGPGGRSRSPSAADTWPATPGPRSSTRCCTRWCISGRPRAGSGWIMGRRSGGRRARSGCSPPRGVRSKLFSHNGRLVRLQGAPRRAAWSPCKLAAVTALHTSRWVWSRGGRRERELLEPRHVDRRPSSLPDQELGGGPQRGRTLARCRSDGVTTVLPDLVPFLVSACPQDGSAARTGSHEVRGAGAVSNRGGGVMRQHTLR